MFFRILHIDHLVLRVRDVARMLDFYRDVLGCSLEKVQERLGLWQLRAGGSLIDLVDLAGPLGRQGGRGAGSEGRNVDHFCLRLEPWDEAALRLHLDRAGVAVGEAGPRYGADGEGPSIYIEDPEGNTVELKGPPFA